MASPVARLLQIQQELAELQSLSKPTPEALQRLQALANELQALQSPPAPLPRAPPPPVLAGYNKFFPQYGAEPPPGCGGCGGCDVCSPAACGNPLPLSVFQGPNGCAPAYTIQGPPGLVGPPGPTGPAGSGGGSAGVTGPTGPTGPGGFTTATSCNGTLSYEKVLNTYDSIGLVTLGPLVRNIPNISNAFFSPTVTVLGGNCRGEYATDLQATRTLITEVASGTGTVIAGGANNMSNGFYANVVGGNGNWVDQSTWASNQQFYATLAANFGVTITYNPYVPIAIAFDRVTNQYLGTNPSIVGTDEDVVSLVAVAVVESLPGGSILGGESNRIYHSVTTYPGPLTGPTNQNVILGGSSNSVTGAYSTVVNGVLNMINDTASISAEITSLPGFNTVLNGVSNVLTGCGNAVVSGDGNTVTNSFFVDVMGNAHIVDSSTYSTVAGNSHTVEASNRSVIAGGSGNTLINCYASVISGGRGNSITNDFSSVIGGGEGNVIKSNGDNSNTIGGGIGNTIGDDLSVVQYNTICGGSNNSITGSIGSTVSGRENTVSNNYCVVMGEFLTTVHDNQIAVGKYNDPTDLTYTQPGGIQTTVPRVFMVGYDSGGGRSNLFSVTDDGWAHALGYATSGADYAEYFESDEDVVTSVVPGVTVVINPDTGKVRPATGSADPILGVVRPKRAQMAMVGNTASDHWHGKFVLDDMGQPVYTGTYEYIPPSVPNDYSTRPNAWSFGDPTQPTTPSSTGTYVYREVRMLNPDYNPSEAYVPRTARLEWNPIGLLGRVLLRPGQPVASKWIRLRAYNSTYDEWYITP